MRSLAVAATAVLLAISAAAPASAAVVIPDPPRPLVQVVVCAQLFSHTPVALVCPTP